MRLSPVCIISFELKYFGASGKSVGTASSVSAGDPHFFAVNDVDVVTQYVAVLELELTHCTVFLEGFVAAMEVPFPDVSPIIILWNAEKRQLPFCFDAGIACVASWCVATAKPSFSHAEVIGTH